MYLSISQNGMLLVVDINIRQNGYVYILFYVQTNKKTINYGGKPKFQ